MIVLRRPRRWVFQCDLGSVSKRVAISFRSILSIVLGLYWTPHLPHSACNALLLGSDKQWRYWQVWAPHDHQLPGFPTPKDSPEGSR